VWGAGLVGWGCLFWVWIYVSYGRFVPAIFFWQELLTISFLGVIGIYLAKVFNETKGRPLYVVKAVHGRDAQP